MHVISEKALREFWKKHADAKDPLKSWLTAAKRAKWQNLSEVRQTFNSADVAGVYTIFNIRGNTYRLVTAIHYNRQKVYIATCSPTPSTIVGTKDKCHEEKERWRDHR